MSLLPIIYTSLILFFGLLLFVIAVSYLAFKSRKRTNPLIEDEIRKQKQQVNNLQYAHTQNNRNSTQQYSDQQIAQVHYSDRNTNLTNPPDNKQDIDNDSYRKKRKRETKTHYIIRPTITNSRIEILNDSSKFITDKNENFHERPMKKDRPDLSEYNLLNFYSDSSVSNLQNRPFYGRQG